MSEPGRLIGPYRLLSVLGRGAMGEVWRARDERLDRLVALKLLPSDKRASAERRARMFREAKAAAAVPHRGVVTLYDIVSEDGDDVLVMELVEGQTLAELVREGGPVDQDRALDILGELAAALAAAHERGILHRDIKSANVMVTPEGAVRVLDFGLAKLLDADEPAPAPAAEAAPARAETGERIALDETVDSVDQRVSETMPAVSPTASPDGLLLTRAGQLLGTPIYMAPEQYAGEQPSEKSEVFSVGVLGYELLAGAPPFTGADLDELQRKVLNDDPAPLPGPVDPELKALVSRALEKDPADRVADMAAMRDRLAAIRERRRAPPRRLWPLALGLALAAAAIAVAVWVLGRDRTAATPPPEPERPGDRYVEQALGEYNLFYNQKAAASLRAAARVAPDHPLVPAYAILFGVARGSELDRAVAEARRFLRGQPAPRERALLEAAVAAATEGPARARAALLASGAELDSEINRPPQADHSRGPLVGELQFWAAELAYRARDYAAAERAFRQVLARGDPAFRGRVYDHYSAVLSYFGKADEALEIGRAYAKAFAGEPDAIGVYATTLARAGHLDEALEQAREARRLYEGEDTVAGLAKVHALRGELDRARELYRKSVAMAPDSRRPLRRAALAYLAWIQGDDEEAHTQVAACLPGGEDAGVWERGPCLWVAGVVWPERTGEAVAELESLARAATPLRPAYGFPSHLANLLRARQIHFAGACRRPQPKRAVSAADRTRARALLENGRDFFAQYHIPFFADYARCELTALRSP